jgi:1-acyl-sn-glycerol-3-phosphate acyltransferase
MRSWWFFIKFMTRVIGAPTWQIRPYGTANVPRSGGVLLACTHQSFLDPLLLASCLDRELHYMARRTLFDIPIFGRLLVATNAFPIDRDKRDVKGVKTAIERLKAGNALVVFPEGTRTRDGRIAPMKSGVRLLAERAAVPVVPVLIDGAHEVWPRSRVLPGVRGRIDIVFGRPFPGSECGGDRVRDEIVRLRGVLRHKTWNE